MSVNSISSSFAFSSAGMTIDAEYQRIIRALQAYGIAPTGDKSADKAKLQKIEAAKKNKDAQFANSYKSGENPQKTETISAFTDTGSGTDQMAMLNKLKLGLL